MRKTTANRLLKAITDNLVSVTSAVVNHDESGSPDRVLSHQKHKHRGVRRNAVASPRKIWRTNEYEKTL